MSFNEAYSNPRRDPLAPPDTCDFDWDELSRNLGEPQGDDDTVGVAEPTDANSRTEDVVLHLLVSLIGTDSRRGCDRRIGRRAVALGWLLRPEIFDGKSVSRIAADLGIPRSKLATLVAGFSREINYVSRGQCHGSWARKKKN